MKVEPRLVQPLPQSAFSSSPRLNRVGQDHQKPCPRFSIMPVRPPHPCNHPGCSQLTHTRFCEQHTQQFVKEHSWQHKSGKTAAERGYDYRWQKLRQVVLKRDSYLCQECTRQNRVAEATDVDHIIPKADGGTDDLNNLQSLCTRCHKEKTNREKNSKVRRT